MNISNGQLWKYTSFTENKNYSFSREKILNVLDKSAIDKAYNTISNWETYAPTPLLNLNKLSKDPEVALLLSTKDTK